MKHQMEVTKKSALQFVILISIVSLFADMTYEGARGIAGSFLAVLGANAIIVGFVSGFGELVGYALRIVSGFIADRTQKYWLITIVGYTVNLLAVPLLALAGHWWVAATLMILERTGKAIRVPPRDAMLSHAGHQLGMGWVFGLHEAIDQIGGMLGPLLVASVLYFKNNNYRESFAILFIPAVFSLTTLAIARWYFPHPKNLEMEHTQIQTKIMTRSFWLYLISASLIAAGYADFPLIAYHFQKQTILSPVWISIYYAFAMGVTAMTSPIFGYLYDKYGFVILIIATILSCFFAPFVFFGNFTFALCGVALWSLGVGAHESLMRAIVANMIPANKRSSAYGIFNAVYGISWFLGSILLGALYDISMIMLVAFSICIQLSAIPLMFLVNRRLRK